MQQSYIVPDATRLLIPSEKKEIALTKIGRAYRKVYQRGTLPEGSDLIDILERLSFIGTEQENGDISISDYVSVDELESDNPVLLALIGITPAGSYLTYYDLQGQYEQIRYDKDHLWVDTGTVVFTKDDTYPFPTQYPNN